MTLYITPSGRVYCPGIGRFLSRDPIHALAGDYVYANNSPASTVDPTGLFGFRPCCLFSRAMITDADLIGEHEQGPDGIVFTCRCGWLDTGHIRQTMDLVFFFYLQLNASSTKGTTLTGFEERFELTQNVASVDILSVAASIAYDEGLLHEIKSYTPEKQRFAMWNSAFSPEDLASNAVGAYAAQTALAAGGPWAGLALPDLRKAETRQKWAEAMDAALTAILEECAALPEDKAARVWNTHVQDKWVTGAFLDLTLQKRNMESAPWNIACEECRDVKDKTVPTWLQAGIDVKRTLYSTRVDIPAELKRIREDIEDRYGKEHLTP